MAKNVYRFSFVSLVSAVRYSASGMLLTPQRRGLIVSSNYILRNIIFMVLIGFMFSCSFNDRKPDSSKAFIDDFKNLDTNISFSGYWLSEDYYNSIQLSRSPQKAQDGSLFIDIPDKTLQQTIMIYNFHEGGTFLKILKHGNKYEVWEVQDDSLTQRLNTIDIISTTKIKLGEKTFVKINPVKTQNTVQILEEILFKGIYTNRDGKTIVFKPNGQLVGFDNFNYYKPIIDYIGEGMQVDQVGLGSSQNDIKWYGFKFNQDTLELYKLNCLTFDSTEHRCIDVGYGQLKYKLWRKK